MSDEVLRQLSARLLQVSVNGLGGVITLVQAGLADRECEVDLVVDPDYSGGGHIGNPRDVSTGVARHRIKCIALDDFPELSGIGVDAMKMDIEGAEGLALHGMRGLIDRSPRLRIMMEFCPAMLDNYDVDASQVVEFFSARGFMCWNVGNDGQLVPASWARLLEDAPGEIRNIVASRHAIVRS